MSSTLSKSLGFSSALKMEEEETMVTKKQGIVSILESEGDRPVTKASSLRRTLSADMSSKKWLTQHGFYPMKKIASSEEFSDAIADSSSSEEEDEYEERKEQFNLWASIQEEKNKKESEKPGHLDIWSLIISQKSQDDTSKSLPSPYIHPLVKRSACSLSRKSLEICTESLGSETGSDGFSFYPPSETGHSDEDKAEEQELPQEKQDRGQFDCEEPRVPKYNYGAVGKKAPQRSFPPPIPSLSRNDGASVRMMTRRDNGRLVLEAISVPSHNNFHAQRQDGRLVLTFANTTPAQAEEDTNEELNELDELVEEFGNSGEKNEGEEDEEEEEAENENRGGKDEGFMMEEVPKFSSGFINVHRLALMMNKPIGLANRNPTWPSKINEKVVKLGEEEEEEEEEEEKIDPTPPLAQSLPLRQPVGQMIPAPQSAVGGVASSLNAYEYFWRSKSMTSVLNPNPEYQTQLRNSKNPVAEEQQLRGNNLAPSLKGCKEPKKSLLLREPHCIATT
ncbi:hypothetical protein SLE2022_003620 [Rubroshorea leprosula]